MTSVTGGAATPFSFGQVFKQGDVPSGQYVSAVGSGLTSLHCTVLTRWLDGSVKFGIVSGRCDLVAGSERNIDLQLTTQAPAASLGLTELKATGIDASINYAGNGTVTWSGADWDAPFRIWAQSPSMSSWIYRKPIGSDAHLVAWLEIRLFAGGAVEVLPWIENGFVNRASPGARSGSATFSLGGTQRFSQSLSLSNHQRAVLGSGTTYSHWLGSDPKLSVRHDVAYFQASKLVPAYRASVAASAGVWNNLTTSYTPLAVSDLPVAMGDTGYDRSIGLLPEWDALYLVGNGDKRAWQAVQVNGYCTGRYGIHFRDEVTNRPIRLSDYPNLVLDGSSGVTATGGSSKGTYTPVASGSAGPSYTNSHAPAFAYFAYLLTGRCYFMEEVQFQATTNYLKNSDSLRQFSAGIVPTSSGSSTLRGGAWAMRTLAMAASIGPSDDPVGIDLRGAINANIDYYHATYVAKASNPQGWVTPYGSNNEPADPWTGPMWQHDFWVAAWGLMKDMGVNSVDRQTKLDQTCAFFYKSIVGRLGPTGADSFGYPYAAQYTMPMAPSNSTDWAGGSGPWYASFGAIARAINLPTTFAANEPLSSGNAPDATSYWGNLQPAISYAVDHGAVGAAEAYNRILGASNWPTLAGNFNTSPVWSVKPRTR